MKINQKTRNIIYGIFIMLNCSTTSLLAATSESHMTSQNLTVDSLNNGLIYTNQKVGIGTPNPTETFGVEGNGKFSNDIQSKTLTIDTNGLIYTSGKKVGIGTTLPNANFHVVGSATISSGLTSGPLTADSTLYVKNQKVGIWNSNPSEKLDVVGNGKFSGTLSSAVLSVNGNISGTTLTIDGNGLVYTTSAHSVGIGTSTPATGYKLDVNGSAQIANDLLVNNNARINGTNLKLFGDYLALYRDTNCTILEDPRSSPYLALKTNGGERLSINSAGLVTIGNNTPAISYTNLQVFGATRLGSPDYESWFPYADGDAYITGKQIFIRRGASNSWATSLFINNAGSVGIGTVNPDTKLHVNGTIHANGRIKDATGYVAPVGTIVAYAGTSPWPEGWYPCHGQSLEIATYPELYAAISTYYGGGGGYFNLPDLRGRVIVAGGDAPFNSLNNSGGEVSHTLTIAEMPWHTHNYHQAWYNHGHADGGSDETRYGRNDQLNNGTTTGEGGTQPHNNMPPYRVLNYIIKY